MKFSAEKGGEICSLVRIRVHKAIGVLILAIIHFKHWPF